MNKLKWNQLVKESFEDTYNFPKYENSVFCGTFKTVTDRLYEKLKNDKIFK